MQLNYTAIFLFRNSSSKILNHITRKMISPVVRAVSVQNKWCW